MAASTNDVTFKALAYPRTARIICDGTIYIKNEQPPEYSAWKEVDEITTGSFFLEGDSLIIQKQESVTQGMGYTIAGALLQNRSIPGIKASPPSYQH
jgi:hypothetical protein